MNTKKGEHIRVCKHKPNNECTHYQYSHNDSVQYLMNKENLWYIFCRNNQWEEVEEVLVKFLIESPIVLDKSIKMERKYDWTGVPDKVKYIATNESGYAFGYEGKPLQGYLHSGFWYGGGDGVFILWPSENQFDSTNWRNSLEGRV